MNSFIYPAVRQFASALKSLKAAHYPCVSKRTNDRLRAIEDPANTSQIQHRRDSSDQSCSQKPRVLHNTMVLEVETT